MAVLVSGWIGILFGTVLELPKIDQMLTVIHLIYYRNTSKHMSKFGTHLKHILVVVVDL